MAKFRLSMSAFGFVGCDKDVVVELDDEDVLIDGELDEDAVWELLQDEANKHFDWGWSRIED